MKSVGTQRPDFKSTITPHLELLLQHSLRLTNNGLDATRLLREALAGASLPFNELPPVRHWNIRLQEILTGRFLNGHHEPSEPIVQIQPGNIDESLVKDNLLIPVASDTDQKQLWLTAGSDSEESYLKAIAGLPAVCRSAMILSYLEGISTREIAVPAGVRPNAVESPLGQGRRFNREELVLPLMSDDPEDISDEQAAESA